MRDDLSFYNVLRGFIGGTIFNKFLQHPDAASFKITVLVRSSDKADKLKQLQLAAQLEVILGSTEDTSLLESIAANSDVVVSLASSVNCLIFSEQASHLRMSEKFLTLFLQVSRTSSTRLLFLPDYSKSYVHSGSQRLQIMFIILFQGGTSNSNYYIQVSEVIYLTGILGDGARGMHATSKVYTDMDISPLLDPLLSEFKPYAFLAQVLIDADNAGSCVLHNHSDMQTCLLQGTSSHT